ncbi:MAG: hypothetical protein CME25_21230 [Gemmatimonadetes bacterium]|nr:hypothetical protein [Gemmatimonadota bacterium]
MNIPEDLFRPILESRRHENHPIITTLQHNLRALCDAHLEPGSSSYIDYEERESDYWLTRSGGRVIPKAIEQLAFGGILLDERYTLEACNILRTVVDNGIVEACGGYNYGRPYHTWRDNCLDAGVSSGLLGISLDLLKPSLSDTDQERCATYLIPFIDYLLDDTPDKEEAKPDWNMAAIGLVGLGLLALALRSYGVLDNDRFAQAIALSKRRCILFLEKGHDGEGSFYEGPAYGGATVHYLAPLAQGLAKIGDRELVDHPGWQLLVEGLAYELIPSTGRPNILNDCSDQFHVEWLALVAAEQKSGLAQWLWQSIDSPPRDGSLWKAPDNSWNDSVTRYLLYLDPAVEPLSPDRSGLTASKHFKNRGLVDLRSGWKSDDFFLSFLCDVFPAGGHRQADRNHFSLHTLGESFAIDSGYALERLPDTTEVLRLGALGEAHNLPMIMGEMQRRGPTTTDGIKEVDLDSDFPFIESDAGDSYPSADRFTRRALCLPNPRGELSSLIIVDRLVFDISDRAMLSWLLHTHQENALELERDKLTIRGRRVGNRCDVHIITPWPGRWKAEPFFDHPRIRYDWFFGSLFCIVAILPYRESEKPPEVSTEGNDDGCGLTISQNGFSDTILTAAQGKSIEFQDFKTDAEFAHVRIEEGRVRTHRLVAGTERTRSGKRLI